MTGLSRRQFLALSATVALGACTDGESAEPAAPASDPTVTGPGVTTPAATRPADASTTQPTATRPPATQPAATTSPATEPAVQLAANPFQLGVASGDPDATSVVLWTRLVGDDLPDELAVDCVITQPSGVHGVTVKAQRSEAYAVHVVAQITGDLDDPLEYRFVAGGHDSPTGRTRLARQVDQLRIASATCQHYETGFYAAHRDIAEWQPDLVLFLGDFIYEGAAAPVGAAGDDVIVRSHDGPEPVDLDGYRRRYAHYLSDPDLQASRAAAAWISVWDDHEVENNYAGDVPSDPSQSAGFAARRADAYRAWWEHTPTRLAAPAGQQPYAIYRGVEYGTLAAISVLDGRQFRSDQACGDVTLSVEPPCPEVFDEARTMLGAEQEAWLAQRFAGGAGVTWNVLGQQTVLSDTRLEQAILNYDQWDGYPAARQRLLDAAPHDLVVITGDIHLAGVGQIGDVESAAPVGVEFVTTSISSAANVDASLEDLVRSLPGIVDVEIAHRGYIRHTVTSDEWVAEYRTVDQITQPGSAVSTWKTFAVAHGSAAVTERA